MRLFGFAMILLLSGCDMGHLGNPLLWPSNAVSTGIENATYNARRKKVESHVAAHQTEIIADIRSNGGPALTKGMDLAQVSPKDRPAFLRILKQDITKFTPNTDQARKQLVVWFMVHGT